MSRMDAFREEFDKMGRDEDYERQGMNYGDREKSKLPDSPIEPYIASWKERRKYALLQAAAILYSPNRHAMGWLSAIELAEQMLSEIESRLPESAE